MDKKWKSLFMAFLFGVIIPWSMFSSVELHAAQPPSETKSTDPTKEPETGKLSDDDDAFFLPVLMEDGSVENLELDTYVTCVVLREMPVEFELEALKAQSVVARTYALKRLESGGKHKEAVVCTDSACCQGYRTADAFLSEGGSKDELQKVGNAVKATSGEVICYNGNLAEATYFSCSGGKTEDAKAVWGSDIPYLKVVESPGEEKAEHFIDTVYMTVSDFFEKIGDRPPAQGKSWLGKVTYTAGGGVDTIEIANQTYKGTDLRKFLGLRSTAFMITVVGDTVTITTKGFGHRVGMSQYGAEAMAVQGSTYREILAYYYEGTELETYGS